MYFQTLLLVYEDFLSLEGVIQSKRRVKSTLNATRIFVKVPEAETIDRYSLRRYPST